MKKYTFIAVLIISMMMTACGSESTTTEQSDSLSTHVGTGSVTGNDTTVAKISDSTELGK